MQAIKLAVMSHDVWLLIIIIISLIALFLKRFLVKTGQTDPMGI